MGQKRGRKRTGNKSYMYVLLCSGSICISNDGGPTLYYDQMPDFNDQAKSLNILSSHNFWMMMYCLSNILYFSSCYINKSGRCLY